MLIAAKFNIDHHPLSFIIFIVDPHNHCLSKISHEWRHNKNYRKEKNKMYSMIPWRSCHVQTAVAKVSKLPSYCDFYDYYHDDEKDGCYAIWQILHFYSFSCLKS